MIAPLWPLLQAAAIVAPMPLRTAGDWTMGCDNQNVCQAIALPRDGQDRAEALTLTIRRDATPGSPARLEVAVPATVAAGVRLTLAIDGKPVAVLIAPGGAAGLALPFEGALLTGLTDGREMTLADPAARVIARASLDGVGATLTAIDEAQGRTGTKEALRDPGRATMRQAVPPLPSIVQPPVTARRARSITPREAERLIDPTELACAIAPIAPRVFRLDATHTLVTISHACTRDALNPSTSVLVLPERGSAYPARFDPADQPYGTNRMPNGVWDQRRRRLLGFHRASSTDQCGRSEEYAWDGERFRLTLRSEMTECRGAASYITTWRAAVTSR